MLRTLLLYGFVARLSLLRLTVCIYYLNNDHPTLSIVSFSFLVLRVPVVWRPS